MTSFHRLILQCNLIKEKQKEQEFFPIFFSSSLKQDARVYRNESIEEREREIFFVFSNDSLTIEKKLRVEDFRLLRQRFNRATLDGYEHTTKDNNRLAGKVEKFDFSSLIVCRLGSLNKDEFIESFQPMLDLTHYANQLEKLFDKVFEILH